MHKPSFFLFILLSFQHDCTQVHAFSNILSKKGDLLNRYSLFAEVEGQQIQIKEKLLKAFDDDSSRQDILACPQSLSPLIKKTRIFGKMVDSYFISSKFGNKYKILPRYYDLTIKSEVDRPLWDLSSSERVGQKFFQIPLISFIYERGYRQNFENFGFPGIEKEFEEANNFFTALNATEVVMDLSCASGFMTRKYLSAGRYSRVIGADLSPSMLTEAYEKSVAEGLGVPELIRCDSAKLPLKSDSLSAIHAGAAMHCWPRLNESLSEIYRVLRPGGALYATTFFTDVFSSGQLTNQRDRQGFYMFKSESEIQQLLEQAGFAVAPTDVVVGAGGGGGEVVSGGGRCVVRREGRRCAIVKAVKLPLNDAMSAKDTTATLTVLGF